MLYRREDAGTRKRSMHGPAESKVREGGHNAEKETRGQRGCFFFRMFPAR